MKKDKPGEEGDYQNLLKMKDIKSLKMDYEAERNWKKEGGGAAGGGGGGGERKQSISSSSSLIDAARAAGLDIAPSGSDPMSSISALLAAAQATGGLPPSCSNPPDSKKAKPSTAGPSASQGLDLSNPQTAMANVNVRLNTVMIAQQRSSLFYILGADADVLLPAETSNSGHGKSQGTEGVSYLRQNFVRQVNVEQTHAHTYWYGYL